MKTPPESAAPRPPPSGEGRPGRSAPAARRRAVLAGCASAAAAGLSAAACSATGPLRQPEGGEPRTAGAVHLVARGWHTDVGLPADRLPPALLPLAQDFPGAAHFLFGFGERAYWTRPDPGSLDALAALVPGPGAILVTALRAPPPAVFPDEDVVALPAPAGGLARLGAFLATELREGGEFRRMAEGPYPGSRFYATSRRYSAAYTCNTWVADALHVAGTGVSPSGVLFARQLIGRARAAAARQQPSPARGAGHDPSDAARTAPSVRGAAAAPS